MAKASPKTRRTVNEEHYKVRPMSISSKLAIADLPDCCGDIESKKVIQAAVCHCMYVGGWESFTAQDLRRWTDLRKKDVAQNLTKLDWDLRLVSSDGQIAGHYAMTSQLIDLLYEAAPRFKK